MPIPIDWYPGAEGWILEDPTILTADTQLDEELFSGEMPLPGDIRATIVTELGERFFIYVRDEKVVGMTTSRDVCGAVYGAVCMIEFGVEVTPICRRPRGHDGDHAMTRQRDRIVWNDKTSSHSRPGHPPYFETEIFDGKGNLTPSRTSTFRESSARWRQGP
jgi:hypothetical protein